MVGFLITYTIPFIGSSLSYSIKCNTDWAAKDSPGVSGWRGIFRDHHALIEGVFHILVLIMPLYSDEMGVIPDMEVVVTIGYTNL